MKNIEGYGKVSQAKLKRVAKWLDNADQLYQDSDIVDILKLTDLFGDEDWKSDNPLRDSLQLTLDHLFRECLQYPGLCPVQRAIADELQYTPIRDDNVSRLFLSASRGAGKSVILSAYIVWLYIVDPNNTVLLMSSTKKLAEESLSMVKSMMDVSPFARHLRPLKDQADAVSYFDISNDYRTVASKDNSLLVAGIGSRVTGRHPRYLILDDVEAAEAGRSSAERDRIHKKIQSELPSMIKASKENPARIIVMGTPHSHDSSYNKLSQELYHRVRFPAYYPDLNDKNSMAEVSQWMIDQVRKDKAETGAPTFPDRFPMEVLDAKLLEMGEMDFQLQFMLDTTMSDVVENPLKLRDLIIVPDDMIEATGAPSQIEWGFSKKLEVKWLRGLGEDKGAYPAAVSEEYGEWEQMCAFLDVSAGGKDSTALAIIGKVGGYLYLLEATEIPGGTSQTTLRKIGELLNKWGCKILQCEVNYGGDMVPALLRPVIGQVCPHAVDIQPVRVTQQKEKRIIQTLKPLFLSHRLGVREKVFRGNESFIKQLTTLKDKKNALKHDDVIDAVASCAAYFTDSLKQDPDVMAMKIAKQIEDEEQGEWENMDRSPDNIWWDRTGVSGARRVHDTQWAGGGPRRVKQNIFDARSNSVSRPRRRSGPWRGY